MRARTAGGKLEAYIFTPSTAVVSSKHLKFPGSSETSLENYIIFTAGLQATFNGRNKIPLSHFFPGTLLRQKNVLCFCVYHFKWGVRFFTEFIFFT